jgi:hypothetical protein
MMNGSLTTTLVLMAGVVISAVLITTSAGLSNNPEAAAQTANATTAANQTGPSIGNLTTTDFQATLDNLDEARNALLNNDPYTAFFAMNDADNELYWTVGETPLQQQISAVRDQLDNAQDAVINQDLGGALEGVNSASVALTEITQQLPQGEEEEEEEEEEAEGGL